MRGLPDGGAAQRLPERRASQWSYCYLVSYIEARDAHL
jgi:hypothetical protein